MCATTTSAAAAGRVFVHRRERRRGADEKLRQTRRETLDTNAPRIPPKNRRRLIELRANFDERLVEEKPKPLSKTNEEQKCVEDPSMMRALIAVYVGITVTGFFVLSSSALGMLDDHNANKEVSVARVTGVLLGLFISNTSSKRVSQTRQRKVAMKGLCPGCKEEVYTFFDNEDKGGSRNSIVEHECHCCGAQLVFERLKSSRNEGIIRIARKGNANE